MHSLTILFFSSLASFIGSLQLGPVNLFVIDTTLNKNKKSAYWISLGGIIPEFIYCSLAIYSGSYFLNNPPVFFIFKIILIIILIIIGGIFFFKKNKCVVLGADEKIMASSKTNHFLKGFSLAILNPQLLPFWMFVLVYFNSFKFLELKSEFDKLAYIGGAGMGAFFLLIILVLTINKFKSRILTFLNNKYYYKVMATLFLAIALQQLITIL